MEGWGSLFSRKGRCTCSDVHDFRFCNLTPVGWISCLFKAFSHRASSPRLMPRHSSQNTKMACHIFHLGQTKMGLSLFCKWFVHFLHVSLPKPLKSHIHFAEKAPYKFLHLDLENNKDYDDGSWFSFEAGENLLSDRPIL